MRNYSTFWSSGYARLAFAPLVAVTVLATACTTAADLQPTASPEQAAHAFLDAFDSLDAGRFEAFFAEDVTMFFPGGPFPKDRVEGKQAVTAAFGQFFAVAKERGASRLGLQPLDLKVQEYGGFSIATFHLRGNGNIGRRSILFRRDGGNWRIVHFHASALQQDK